MADKSFYDFPDSDEAPESFEHWDDIDFDHIPFRLHACLKCGALVDWTQQEMHEDWHKELGK